MPNYARQALFQLALDVARKDDESAHDILEKFVRERHFLVPFAKFSRATWTRQLDAYAKRYRTERRSYEYQVARAYLLTRGMHLPADYWRSHKFVECFRKCAATVLQNPPADGGNLEWVRRAGDRGQEIMNELDSQDPASVERCERKFSSMLNQLQLTLPPPQVVRRLAEADADSYLELLETPALSHIDVDAALERGTAQKWGREEVCRRLAMLHIVAQYPARDKVTLGEKYEELCQQFAKRRSARESSKREMAHELGVWRIRQSEAARWRETMGAERWAQYEQCEARLRAMLPRGVFTHVPRRFWTAESAQAMCNDDDGNLSRLLKLVNRSDVSTVAV